MHLAEIKEVHDNEPKINTDYFLKTHLAIEAATYALASSHLDSRNFRMNRPEKL